MTVTEFAAWIVGKGWTVESFIAVLFTISLVYVEKRLYRQLHLRLKSTRHVWDDIFINALHQPLSFLIWTYGLIFSLQIIAKSLSDSSLIDVLVPFRSVIAVGLLVWFLIRFIRELEDRVIEKNEKLEGRLDPTTVRALCQIFRIAVLVTAGLIALQIFGIPVSGILAFGGMGGIAAGFAAKDLLANFFGAIMIYFDRPFKVGDWICSPDRNIEGTVEYIGWRLTRIRTFDKRPLYVPNGVFSTISVVNPSRMTNRRIKTTIGLRYDDASKVATILSDIETMLKSHEEIDTTQTLMVNLFEFGPSSLNFFIYTFTKTTEWVKFQAIQQDVFLKAIEIIESHGAQCAFPTTTVHLPESAEH